MLRVTPIYGSSLPASHHPPSSPGGDDGDDPPEWLSAPLPSCTLVEYAGMRLLLNAGWDESLPSAVGGGAADTKGGDTQGCGEGGTPSVVPTELPDVDAVLICDSTLSSLGGLPLYFGASPSRRTGRAPRPLPGPSKRKRRRRNPPFLATHPTVKMGQMALYDHHAALSLDGCHPGYSLEDVDAVFGRESLTTLKYAQTVYFPLEGEDEWVSDEGAEGEDDDAGEGMEIDRPKRQTTSSKGGSKSNKLLAVTPHLSGHVVGGCYWVLKQLSDDTEIVLAPTYHHAKERHLAGSTLHKFGTNADALVTMPGGPRGLLGKLYLPPPPANERNKAAHKMIKYPKGNKPILSPPVGSRSEGEMLEAVMAALRRDGNVLLPSDAAGRVLELLLVLDRHWERQRLGGAYNLLWVGPMAANVVEFARSQLEWMAAPLGAQFDSGRGHPYQLKAVTMCASVDEVDAAMEESGGNPSCVVASGAGMDHGPARDLLVRWGGNPDNLVLVTDSARCVPRGDVWFGRRAGATKPVRVKESARPALLAATGGEGEKEAVVEEVAADDVSAYTPASQLLYHWCAAKASGDEMADEVPVDVYTPRRAPLSGEELRRFLAAEEEERRRKEAEEEERAMLREVEIARGRLRLGDDEGGGGKAAPAKAAGAKSGPSAAASARPKKKSRFDQSLFIKFSKPVHMTFDVREEAVGIGQPDSIARHGIGESMGNAQGRGEILEDDYGISVRAESFMDIVTGVDPSKFAGKSGRIGEEVARRGLGFAADGRPVTDASGAVEGDGAAKDGDAEGINEKMLEVADLSSGKGIIKGRNGRPPVKVSVVPRRLDVLAEVVYIPLEGRVGARAARQSVRALQPRHLVIIGGPKSSSLSLADALRSSSGPSSSDMGKKEASALAHAPVDGETVQLTVGHAAYGVRLIDTPYLTQQEKEEMELAGKEVEPVEAPFEAKIGDCTVSLVDFVATGKKWAVDGSLVLAPRRRLEETTLNQPSLMISTREVLLTDLRAEVTALGMKAEYGALSGYSQLIVNGKIFVRKDNATGKLDVEGPLCDDFYTVRSVVTGQYVTV